MGDSQRAPQTKSGMKLTWSPEAIDDLNSLRAQISVDDPAAAKRVALHILHCVEELLPRNPQLARPTHLKSREKFQCRIFDPDKIVIFCTIISGKMCLLYIYRGELS